MNKLHKFIHTKVSLTNRIKVLTDELSTFLEESSKVLDVGSGSGDIAYNLHLKTKADIIGMDVLVREDCKIPVRKYDGKSFPFADNEFDYVLFVDVLHHTANIEELLNEAKRVCRKGIILKDHNCNNKRQLRILKFTDWFGNAQYGVHLEFNFQSRENWKKLFERLELKESKYTFPKIYPSFTRIVFWKDLDFISLLKP